MTVTETNIWLFRISILFEIQTVEWITMITLKTATYLEEGRRRLFDGDAQVTFLIHK